jgi:hypothetical protein
MLKNVTLGAEDGLIAQAHRRAQRERKMLSAAFHEWLVRNSNLDRRQRHLQDHVDLRTLIYIVLRLISSKQGIAKVNG